MSNYFTGEEQLWSNGAGTFLNEERQILDGKKRRERKREERKLAQSGKEREKGRKEQKLREGLNISPLQYMSEKKNPREKDCKKEEKGNRELGKKLENERIKDRESNLYLNSPALNKTD